MIIKTKCCIGSCKGKVEISANGEQKFERACADHLKKEHEILQSMLKDEYEHIKFELTKLKALHPNFYLSGAFPQPDWKRILGGE